MVLRDVGYMIRIKILSEQQLTWKQSFRIIMLWEFTSAVTPSAIGGTSLAVLYVNKEGIPVGRSTAIVMATSFLDELFLMQNPEVLGWLKISCISVWWGMLSNSYGHVCLPMDCFTILED